MKSTNNLSSKRNIHNNQNPQYISYNNLSSNNNNNNSLKNNNNQKKFFKTYSTLTYKRLLDILEKNMKKVNDQDTKKYKLEP